MEQMEKPTRPKPEWRRSHDGIDDEYASGFSLDDVDNHIDLSGKPEVTRYKLHESVRNKRWENIAPYGMFRCNTVDKQQFMYAYTNFYEGEYS